MRTALAGLFVVLAAAAGCQVSRPAAAGGGDGGMFVPVAMRVHPIFTRVRDWTGDAQPDGVEALLEFQDQFGDPTKATGRVIFELFDYRRGWPDPRGNRLSNPWVADLRTPDEQRERWKSISRTYSFQLAFPPVRSDRNYVLTAEFELAGGGRFFDRIVLEGQPRAGRTTTQESTRVEPGTQPASRPDRP